MKGLQSGVTVVPALVSHTGHTLVEGLQSRVTELESECDRERVVREEAQRDRDRLKVGWGVPDMTVWCAYYFVVMFCIHVQSVCTVHKRTSFGIKAWFTIGGNGAVYVGID